MNKIKTNKKVKIVNTKLVIAFCIMVLILVLPVTVLAEDAADTTPSTEESTQTADFSDVESSSSETRSTDSTESSVLNDSTASKDNETTEVNDIESSNDITPPPVNEAPASEGSDDDPESQPFDDNLDDSEQTESTDSNDADSVPDADNDETDNSGNVDPNDDGQDLSSPETEETPVDDPDATMAGEANSSFTTSYFQVQEESMNPLFPSGTMVEIVSEEYAEGDIVVAQKSDGTYIIKMLSGDQLVSLDAGTNYAAAEVTILGTAASSTITETELVSGDITWHNALATTSIVPTGDGSSGSPYQINTWENLYWLSQTSVEWGENYIQTANIVFPGNHTEKTGGIYEWDGGKGWTPIGNDTTNFTGSYNGGEFTISNLFIDRPDDYIGLFGYLDSNAVVENVHLVNVDITGGNNYIGGLVGYNKGTINNSSATGNVTGSYGSVGGLVGLNSSGGTIKNSDADVTVTATNIHVEGWDGGGYKLGGLVGENNGTIENSYANGTVTGRGDVGGLVGYNSGTIKDNSYADGTVDGITNQIGGLVGYNNGTIENSYANGIVDGNNYVGGLVGHSYNGTINNSYATGNVTGIDGVGGLVGYNRGTPGTINNSYATGVVKGVSYVGGLVGINKSTIENSYATGSVTGTGSQIGGLVGSNDTGTISNCYTDVDVTGSDEDTGGLVGYNNGTISNCYAIGTLEGVHAVGGLVGYNSIGTYFSDGGIIENSYAAGKVTGTTEVGGLVGNGSGSVTNSYYDSQTTGQSDDTGKGEPKTTEEMKTLATYENWDITGQDGFYPQLGWQVNWSANTWYMGTPPILDNTSADLGFFDFAFPLAIHNSSGLTTITNQGNAPITPGIIASGSWNDLNQAVAAYQAALVSLENKITTSSPAELALLEVELVIARAAIMALEAKLLAADGKPFNLASLQAAYTAAVAALNSNQSFLNADQQAAANQLLTAVAGVIAALE